MIWDHKLFKRHLTTRRFGREAAHFAELDSTNAYLAAHAGEFAMSGGVVIADHQTAGRGRYARTWHDAPGKSLLFSLLLRQSGDGDYPGLWTLLPATALAVVLENCITPGALRLKWPNDLLVNGRKAAGILGQSAVENGRTVAVIGVGLNVSAVIADFPPELQSSATSLRRETGGDPRREILLAEILAAWEALHDQLLCDGAPAIIAQWERYGPPRGTPLTRTDGAAAVNGRFAGLGEQGQLRLADDREVIHEFFSGETAE